MDSPTDLVTGAFTMVPVAPDGDCCPLSFGAGYEFTAEEARTPTVDTATGVSKVRNGAINIVAGGRMIDGNYVKFKPFREAFWAH